MQLECCHGEKSPDFFDASLTPSSASSASSSDQPPSSTTTTTLFLEFTGRALSDTRHNASSYHSELLRNGFGLNRDLSPLKASTFSEAVTVISSDEEEEDGDDNDWTSADEVEAEVELYALIQPKAPSHSRPPPAPPPINHRTTRSGRQMPADLQKHLHMDELQHALEEAEHQKEMFTFYKLPKRSYSNLSQTTSGLLSQLMHPDPRALRDVYRRGYSSGDLPEKPRPGPPQLHPSQSTAALPVAAQVHVGSVRNGGLIKSGHYRPKAPPNEEEMEEETDGEDNSLNVSNSVTQKRLKAIFGNMWGGGPNGNANKVAPIRPPHVEGPEKKVPPRTQPMVPAERPVPVAAALECTMTEPVAVPTFPYNLPVSAIPVSPRTTRQWMLRTEMSESVRTNLLWQRKMDKRLMPPPRRNKSSTAISMIPSVVKLTEKKAPVDGEMMVEQEREREREEARHEIRRVNLMRNKSWAADYHPQ